MKTATFNVEVRFRRILLARAWVRACGVLAHAVGRERAKRWALAGMARVVRYQINGRGPLYRL